MIQLLRIILISGLSFYLATTWGGTTAVTLWATGWFVYMTIICLVLVDSQNMLPLKLLRFFPAILLALEFGAILTCTLVLSHFMTPFASLYFAMITVVVSDFFGEFSIGRERVTLMGRNHMGRPNYSWYVRNEN